jgi:hypothetical protein
MEKKRGENALKKIVPVITQLPMNGTQFSAEHFSVKHTTKRPPIYAYPVLIVLH